MPILLITFQLAARRGLKVKMSVLTRRCSVNQSIPLKIEIENNSPFPIMNCEIAVGFALSSGGEPETVKINTPIFPHNKQTLSAAFSSEHFGIVNCRIEYVKIFDMLRLSRFKLHADKIEQYAETIMILPDSFELNNTISDYSELGLDSENFSSSKAGDDPSEIFSIHEYQDGDKLSKIHWKLTAKQDKLMVKDYSLPLADSFLIIADTYTPDGEDSAAIYDAVIQLAASISSLLERNSIRHRISSYDEKNGSISDESVFDEETHIAACEKLLLCGTCSKPGIAVTEILSDEENCQRYGHMLLITSFFDDGLASVISSCGKAYRCTVLLCGDENPPVTNADIDIIPVTCGAAAQSVSELIL
jgi:hypothetical protein